MIYPINNYKDFYNCHVIEEEKKTESKYHKI